MQDRLVFSRHAAVVLAPVVWVLSYAFAASPSDALTIAVPLTVLSCGWAVAALKGPVARSQARGRGTSTRSRSEEVRVVRERTGYRGAGLTPGSLYRVCSSRRRSSPCIC
jgi:hypothetical protein